MAQQLLDAMLGWLGLQLFGRAHIRQQRHVHVEHVVAPNVLRNLADGLEERLALDVADRAADLDDDHLGRGLLRQRVDALLDLVGDVGDDLDRAAEVARPRRSLPITAA